MCGIVAALSSYLTVHEKAIFKDLMRVSVLRGTHSTGVAAAFRKDDEIMYSVHKTTRNAISAFETPSKDLKAIMECTTPTMSAIIGHTRAATKGSIKMSNAHPFVFNRVIGVHNGTIHNHLLYDREFETDSEALYKDINNAGLEDALQQINRGCPAYALVMFDRETNELLAIRNDKRPLHFTFNSSGSTLYIASEADILAYVMNKHNTRYKDQLFPLLKPDHLLRCKISPDGIKEMTIKKIDVEKKFYNTHWVSGVKTFEQDDLMDVWGHDYFEGYAGTGTGVWTREERERRRAVAESQRPVAQLPAPKTEVKEIKESSGKSIVMSKSQRKKFLRSIKKEARKIARAAKDAQKESERREASDVGEDKGCKLPDFITKGTRYKGIKRLFKTAHETANDNKTLDLPFDVDQPIQRGPASVLLRQAIRKKEAREIQAERDNHYPHALDEVDPLEDTEDEDIRFLGHGGLLLTKDKFEKLIMKGCTWCSAVETQEHYHNIQWVDDELYVCAGCIEDDPSVRDYLGLDAKPAIN